MSSQPPSGPDPSEAAGGQAPAGGGAQPPYGQPYGAPPPPPPSGAGGGQPPGGPYGGPPRDKGFFGALFDFSFEHFVTPMLVKAVYVIAIVALGIGWLFWLVTSFRLSPGLGVAVLIFGPVLIFLYLCLIRMTLEFYLAVTRMSQEIHQRLR